MAHVTALKEKLLLFFGIVCILIGVMGVSAAGVAYYYTDSALNMLPNDIEWLLFLANYTANDVATVAYNITALIRAAANDLESIPVVGGWWFRSAVDSLRETAFSVEQVGANVSAVSGDLEELKTIMLDEISSIRLTAQITFSWIGVLDALFIIIGVSILHIRNSLQSHIMKEKLLLSFGIVCILIGAIGVSAVGVAYYYTAPALNELPSDIERLYDVTNQTTTSAATAVSNVAMCADLTAYLLNLPDSVPIVGGQFGDTSASLHVTAASINQVGDDVKMVNGYLEELKDILLDATGSIRLTIEIALGWIGVVHGLFIVIGVSILRIRKSLQNVIK